ncbi:Trehalose-6-phosphate phosphatase [Corynebacterium atrinae]|uniref:trehalose-phosphatase n=1 Tax=Corynebacterium atrinae TaxID=1336740 RepID=UPI0025B434E7|nr:trehalose-phosphatase [Corynebacterium atrinae]WJY64312.1 Trehalose-6-phosphate phosphatase [Corynebacterium atrinae]
MTASLHDLAAAESLLVISDFDGTIAGFSTDAYDVPVNQEAVNALQELAALPNTHVAVLSGRHLAGLHQVCHLQPPVMFSGSHGAESDVDGVVLTEEMAARLSDIEDRLAPLIAAQPLAFVEAKPFQRVLHVAKLAASDEAAAKQLLARAVALEHPGMSMIVGKNIVEFSVADVNKGTWIAATIKRLQPTRALFLGDDTTDEDGFLALRPQDLGVKVGEGETAATMRIADTVAVGNLFSELLEQRRLSQD